MSRFVSVFTRLKVKPGDLLKPSEDLGLLGTCKLEIDTKRISVIQGLKT